MNAIKEIVEVRNDRIVVDLPQHFGHTTVEVIILALDTQLDRDVSPFQNIRETSIDFDHYFGVTNIGTVTLERRLHTLRSEWERDVSH